jgi:hypothetical protein
MLVSSAAHCRTGRALLRTSRTPAKGPRGRAHRRPPAGSGVRRDRTAFRHVGVPWPGPSSVACSQCARLGKPAGTPPGRIHRERRRTPIHAQSSCSSLGEHDADCSRLPPRRRRPNGRSKRPGPAQARLRDAKEQCRAERIAARERARALHLRVLEELREAMRAERVVYRAPRRGPRHPTARPPRERGDPTTVR